MAAPSTTVVFACVLDEWTGYVTVTVGGSTALYRPPARASIAEVMRDIARAAARVHGSPGSWVAYFNASGKAVIEGPSTFTLGFGGSIEGRLGWAATSYSGASSYTAGTAISSLTVGPAKVGLFANGIGVTGIEGGGLEPGEPLATTVDGGELGAVSHPMPTWADGQLALDGVWSGIMAQLAGFEWGSYALQLESGYEWDVALQGRVIGRCRFGATRIETRGRGGANLNVGLRAALPEVR